MGRFPNGVDALATQVCADLTKAGFAAKPQQKVMPLKYKKLTMNLSNALGAAVGTSQAEPVATMIKDEAFACFKAANIEVTEDDEYQAQAKVGVSLGEIPGVPADIYTTGGSSRQSLERAQPDIETDYLNGEIVLLGRMFGVPTPANAALVRCAQDMVSKSAAPGSVSMEQLMREIEKEKAPATAASKL